MAKKAIEKATLDEMSGDKPRPVTLSVEHVKGESALIEDVKPELTPAERKLSIIDWQKSGAKQAKKSAAERAKYREMAAGLVQPMASTIDDVPHITGIDAAYNYLLETTGRPPHNFMVYLAVAFIVGAAVGGFAIAI